MSAFLGNLSVKDLMFFSILKILAILIGFLFVVISPKFLGSEKYVTFVYYWHLVSVTSIFLSFSSAGVINRFYNFCDIQIYSSY